MQGDRNFEDIIYLVMFDDVSIHINSTTFIISANLLMYS